MGLRHLGLEAVNVAKLKDDSIDGLEYGLKDLRILTVEGYLTKDTFYGSDRADCSSPIAIRSVVS